MTAPTRWPMFIDGAAVDRAESLDVTDPATGSVFATVPQAASADVDDAVAAARRTFESGPWAGMRADERSRVLWRIADLITEHAGELARLESRNQGAPLSGMLASVIPAVARTFRYYAGAAERIDGRARDVVVGERTLHAYTRREPIGVVGIVVPWNAPLTVLSWKLAPALAVGCTCVVKPADETPLTALRLAQLCAAAGVPDGVINVVTGIGATTGAALSAHPDVDKISFTGSTEVGRLILAAAGGNLKKVTLELGGKSPVIVMDDADPAAVIPGAAAAIFANAGQNCTAGSRLLVSARLHDQVVDGVTRIARTMHAGAYNDPAAELGPMISARHRDRVAAYVDGGRESGADVTAGGTASPGAGFFYPPTVIANATAQMRLVREEIFGPVVAVMRFEDEEEAVHVANATAYGLAASIWTKDIGRAHRIAARVRAGRIGINVHAGPEVTMPTGGYKQSGWGRELGVEGLAPYLETKSVFVGL